MPETAISKFDSLTVTSVQLETREVKKILGKNHVTLLVKFKIPCSITVSPFISVQ
jgi:hypothetical protein